MILAPYREQVRQWPVSGQHVLAQFDNETIIVYQAFNHTIADAACRGQRFGEGFSLSRMSWIKTNFLWMMYRSGWATKPGQERVLAIRLRRAFFDNLLARGIPSTFQPDRFESREAWADAVSASDVRLQWDPDHDPAGASVLRRAVQLGLRGATLAEYVNVATVSITDITELVSTERPNARPPFDRLQTPLERVYVPV